MSKTEKNPASKLFAAKANNCQIPRLAAKRFQEPQLAKYRCK